MTGVVFLRVQKKAVGAERRGGLSWKKEYPGSCLQQEPAAVAKQLLTCGLLQVLVTEEIKTVSFKCGPDYIDPMFHTQVIGTKIPKSGHFFYRRGDYQIPSCKNSADCEIAVMEGVWVLRWSGRNHYFGKCLWSGASYGYAGYSDREQQGNECLSCCLHKRLSGIQKRQPHKRRDF